MNIHLRQNVQGKQDKRRLEYNEIAGTIKHYIRLKNDLGQNTQCRTQLMVWFVEISRNLGLVTILFNKGFARGC
jgi:hypothetical protein